MVFWFKSYKRGVNKPFSLWNFPLHIPNSGFSCLPQTKQVPEGKDSWEDADMGWRFLGLICQLCSLVWATWYTAAIYQTANSEAGVNPVLNENFPVTSWCSSSWCSSSAPAPPTPNPQHSGPGCTHRSIEQVSATTHRLLLMITPCVLSLLNSNALIP